MPNEINHSPTPWKHRIWDYGTIEDANGKPIAKVYSVMPGTPDDDRKTTTHRRLFINAPGTYEALCDVTQHLERLLHATEEVAGPGPYEIKQAIERANAAIAAVQAPQPRPQNVA